NRLANPTYGDRWTAISRPPYFTALALWPLTKRFGGGGRFVDKHRLILNHWGGLTTPHPDHPPKKDWEILSGGNHYMGNAVSYYRLNRDHWHHPNRDYYWEWVHFPRWYKGPYQEGFDPKIELHKGHLHCRVSYRCRVLKNRGKTRNSLYEVLPEYHYS